MGSAPSTDYGTIDKFVNSSQHGQSSLRVQVLAPMLNRLLSTMGVPPTEKLTTATATRFFLESRDIHFEESKNIITKGEDPGGIYFVVEGRADVISEADDQLGLSSIHAGDFFGELSVLFNIKSTATVRTQGRVHLIHIPLEESRLLLKEVEENLLDWYIKRRYLPTNNLLDGQDLVFKMAVSCIRQVPLFSDWTEAAVRELVTSMVTQPVILYPQNSYLLCPEDLGDVLVILVRGRASVFGVDDQELTSIQAVKFPFTFNYEGLFKTRPPLLRVEATCPSLAITLKKSKIRRVAKQMPDDAGRSWARCNKQWSAYLRKRNETIKEDALDKVQVELLYKYLRETVIFGRCPIGFVYETVLGSIIRVLQTGDRVLEETEIAEKTLVYFLHGGAKLSVGSSLDASYGPGDVYYNKDRLGDNASFTATSECTVLKVPEASITSGQLKYPDAMLTL